MYKLSNQLSSEATNAIRFWRDIELFNLPDIDSTATFYPFGTTLPWENEYQPITNHKWQHIIYIGKITKEEANNLIRKAVAPTQHTSDWQEELSGSTYMAVMITDQYGQLETNGYMQASYTIALSCIENDVPLTAMEYLLPLANEQHKERLHQSDYHSHQGPSQIAWNHLKSEHERLNSIYPDTLNLSDGVHIKSIPVHESYIPETTFFSSSYLKDLNQLLREEHRIGKGLLQLLTSEDHIAQRTDVLKDTQAFRDSIDPANLSPGRWPFSPSKGLYSTQLGALNTTTKYLRNHNGILSIHNPPGTGKTTLLADMMADLVVSRATAMINTNIDTLFETTSKITHQHKDYFYYPAISRVFKDAGIVVACNNNAAADQIARELPLKTRIDAVQFPEAGYFKEEASDLNEGNNWGCIAAVLGNSASNNAFKANFWMSTPTRNGFYDLLKSAQEPQQQAQALLNYNDTKQELIALLEEFESFKKTAITFHALASEMNKVQESLKNANTELHVVRQTLINLSEENLRLETYLNRITLKIRTTEQEIELHVKDKPQPFFIHRLLNTRKHRPWTQKQKDLRDKIGPLQTSMLSIKYRARLKTAETYHLKKKIADLEEVTKLYEDKILIYTTTRNQLHSETGIAYSDIPDVSFYANFEHNQDKLHRTCPWSSPKINILRSKIFLCSLKLHEHAVLYHAKAVKNNLCMLLDMLEGRALFSEGIAQGLWRTLFFCIPVVTTTITSAPRIFSTLGTESIGWLLIDEAGQATPQSTAGLINRAQKCVIIGDPMQTEPAITVNTQLIENLRHASHANITWSPALNSTQTLADRVTPIGTAMKDRENRISWSGYPLRSHNRCYEPMFSLVNKIAYENKIVKLRPDAEFSCITGPSQWFDVKTGTVVNEQVIQEEIQLLKTKIRQPGMEKNTIFIISPFKAVALKCQEEFAELNYVTSGTTHTFQGKKADLVFLVLGSDPQTPEAREWASGKLNFLNSALTRATKRFYVIGNKELWRKYKYFQNLAHQL